MITDNNKGSGTDKDGTVYEHCILETDTHTLDNTKHTLEGANSKQNVECCGKQNCS